MRTIIALLVFLVIPAAAYAAQSPVATVHVKDFAFSPATLVVNVGDTVAFVNDDDDAHTVTSSNGAFDSKGLDTNGRWEYTFKKPGKFTYFCALHPYMKGTIVVKAVAQ